MLFGCSESSIPPSSTPVPSPPSPPSGTIGVVPTAPSNLVAVSTTVSQINLSWVDNSTNELGFKLERKSSPTVPYAPLATLGTNITVYSDVGLSANSTYIYRVYSYNSAGNSSTYSNELAVSSSDPPVISAFVPACGSTGTPITIIGTSFDSAPSANIVKFNGTIATVITSTTTSITTTVPIGATPGTITVTVTNANQSGTSSTAFLVAELTDIDCNSYNVVTIGTQKWMSENLRTSKYANGDPIANVLGITEWSGLTTGAWSHYNNDPAFNSSYGKIYNFFAVADSRKLCPVGWHVPSESDWTVLTNYLGGVAVSGGKMKAVGTQYWNSPNTGATNQSGLTALAGGYRAYDVNFSLMTFSGYWWGSTDAGPTVGILHGAAFDHTNLFVYTDVKTNGFSVRCIKD